MRPDGRPSGPNRPEAARVFFALWPDAEALDILDRAAIDGAARFGGRATKRETQHLTLAFLGDVILDRLPTLHEAAGRVACPAFRFSLDRLGFWRHNRILWAGSSHDERPLAGLVHGLVQEIRGVGGKVDGGSRPFVPHVTLVRNVRDNPQELPPLAAVAWECREFVLVRSRLSARGAAYETLGRWSLSP